MSTATNGRAREHRVAEYLDGFGWRKLMRAAGSKGSADLLMAHPFYGAMWLQVGTGSKRLGPFDRVRFLNDAGLIGALPILAVCHQGERPKFYEVTLDPPASWRAWSVDSLEG